MCPTAGVRRGGRRNGDDPERGDEGRGERCEPDTGVTCHVSVLPVSCWSPSSGEQSAVRRGKFGSLDKHSRVVCGFCDFAPGRP